jgi:hypothetical protein
MRWVVELSALALACHPDPTNSATHALDGNGREGAADSAGAFFVTIVKWRLRDK